MRVQRKTAVYHIECSRIGACVRLYTFIKVHGLNSKKKREKNIDSKKNGEIFVLLPTEFDDDGKFECTVTRIRNDKILFRVYCT